MTMDGLSAHMRVTRYGTDDAGGLVCVDDSAWSTQWTEEARYPTSASGAHARGPMTPVPGTVTVVNVAAGDTLVVIEAMKMEHRITADDDAVVAEVLVGVGQSVDAHEVVVVLAAAVPTADADAESDSASRPGVSGTEGRA
jgi:propionyl-CoA carboxylase alpha chain